MPTTHRSEPEVGLPVWGCTASPVDSGDRDRPDARMMAPVPAELAPGSAGLSTRRSRTPARHFASHRVEKAALGACQCGCRLARAVEVVGQHVVGDLLADGDAVLDRCAVVDPAPDAGLADLALELLDRGVVAIAEAGQAGHFEVDER
jgi:hypothetical protein